MDFLIFIHLFFWKQIIRAHSKCPKIIKGKKTCATSVTVDPDPYQTTRPQRSKFVSENIGFILLCLFPVSIQVAPLTFGPSYFCWDNLNALNSSKYIARAEFCPGRFFYSRGQTLNHPHALYTLSFITSQFYLYVKFNICNIYLGPRAPMTSIFEGSSPQNKAELSSKTRGPI